MEQYLLGIIFLFLGVGIVSLAIINGRLCSLIRPWWLPKAMDEENFFGRFFTGVIGVFVAIIGSTVLVFSILGK